MEDLKKQIDDLKKEVEALSKLKNVDIRSKTSNG